MYIFTFVSSKQGLLWAIKKHIYSIIMTVLKNSVRLIGFLGSDPEIKTFGDNRTVARVSIAINDSYKNKEGEWVTDTQWHNLVMWGAQAQFAEKKLEKGSEILVEGKLINRSYTDFEGVTRYFTDIKVNEIQIIKNKDQNN